MPVQSAVVAADNLAPGGFGVRSQSLVGDGRAIADITGDMANALGLLGVVIAMFGMASSPGLVSYGQRMYARQDSLRSPSLNLFDVVVCSVL